MEWVSGRHAVFHLLSAGRRKVLRVHLQKGLEKTETHLADLARKRGVPISLQVPTFFSTRLASLASRSESCAAGSGRAGSNHQGVAAETQAYPYLPLESLFGESFLLILDEIQDPQNLGALCRSAYLFGVGGVVIPETHSASVGAGTLQASVGAIEYLKISRVWSIAKALELLKKEGFWVYGADQGADRTIYEEAYPEKVALVIGSEERGLRRLVKEKCDVLVRIPTVGKEIGSLNASVAGGVILAEIYHQRAKKPLKQQEKY